MGTGRLKKRVPGKNRWEWKGSNSGDRRASDPQRTGPLVKSLSAVQKVGAAFGGGPENGALKSLLAKVDCFWDWDVSH